MVERDDDWNGYDPAFLGIPLPLPVTLGDEEVRELRYPRFTVVLDPARRFAVATGVNIDGATLHDLERRGEWQLDPRVTADEQAGPAVDRQRPLEATRLGWGHRRGSFLPGGRRAGLRSGGSPATRPERRKAGEHGHGHARAGAGRAGRYRARGVSSAEREGAFVGWHEGPTVNRRSLGRRS